MKIKFIVVLVDTVTKITKIAVLLPTAHPDAVYLDTAYNISSDKCELL